MTVDLTRKRIIMIHGLASKPPPMDLHRLWSKCLVENVRTDDPELAGALDADPRVLVHAYWANAIPHHIEDDAGYVEQLGTQVSQVIEDRRTLGHGFHVGRGPKIKAFFKDKALDVVDVFSNALTIKDNITKQLLREIELYSEDQYIADIVREPLETLLRRAWDEDCDVALLSHSMGTFIAYDVLWRFSHRSVPGFQEYAEKRVRMFVTMGSPLGDNMVRDLLFAKHHKGKDKREYPRNIDFWHNYACLGDVVAHDNTLSDDFFKPMRKLKLVPDQPKHRAIDYRSLFNPFKVVTHDKNKKKSKRNPHKSYGYLVQPRLGTWMRDFLLGKLEY